MGFLNREELLKQEPCKIEKVDIGDGDFVFVKEMNGFERDAYEQLLFNDRYTDGKFDNSKPITNFKQKMLACSICEEDGKLMLQPNDYIKLAQSRNYKAINKMFEVSSKLNNVEEVTKNSEADIAKDSPLDSASL